MNTDIEGSKNLPDIEDSKNLPDVYNNYVVNYINLMKLEISDNWQKGDIAKEIYKLDKETKKKSGKSEILNNFLKTTGETKTAFTQHRWVAEKFNDEKTRKLPGLTWTHYRAAAGTNNCDKWIKEAHDNSWSITKLIDEICREKDVATVDSGILCNICTDLVSKEKMITLSYCGKKRVFCCSINCAKQYLSNLDNTNTQKINTKTSVIGDLDASYKICNVPTLSKAVFG